MDNGELVRHFYDAVWTRGALDEGLRFLDPDLIDHDAMAFPGRASGAEGLLQVVGMVRAAIPDLSRAIEQQVVQGDLVATRFTDTGTHEGEFMGLAATGKSVTLAGINIERVEGDRIREIWHVEDLHGLLQQLGAA